MEFLIAGVFMIISSNLLKLSRKQMSNSSSENNHGGEYFWTLLFGIVLLFIGATGLLGGVFQTVLNKRELAILFFLAFALNVQARLINYTSLDEKNAEYIGNKKANGASTIKTAFSIGAFPKSGTCSTFISVIQLVQILLIASFVYF